MPIEGPVTVRLSVTGVGRLGTQNIMFCRLFRTPARLTAHGVRNG